MKTRPTFWYVLFASLLPVACTTEVTDEQYVKLEQVACSFYGSDNEPLEIKIKSNPSTWEAESNAAWLEVGKSEDGSMLTLTATDNDTDSERSTVVTVTAGEAIQEIKVNQLGLDIDMPRYRTLMGMSSAISPSGRYIGGFESSMTDGSYVFHPCIIDTYTGEKTVCGDIPESQFAFAETTVMSDGGLLFIRDGSQDIMFDRDGNYTVVRAEGYASNPRVQSTSSDGRYWVGYAMKETDKSEHGRMYWPLVWIDGEIHELEIPDSNFRGESFYTGLMARGISANGSVIYGTTWDNDDFGMVYWTDINSSPEYVGKDVHEINPVTVIGADGNEYISNFANGMICTANRMQISPSGTWIAGSYRTETLAEDRQTRIREQYAAFYNTATETTTIIKDYGESTGLRATDDGIAFIGLGTGGITEGVVYDLNGGAHLGTTQEWIYNNYGLNVPTGIVNFINADKDIIFGTYAVTTAQGTAFCKYYIAPPIAE